MPPPYEKYAEELFSTGHGLPLWVPESLGGTEVHVGAVGWLTQGGFRTLFNALVPAEHPLNSGMFVPPSHKPLVVDPRLIRDDAVLTDPFICSQSGGHIVANASAQTIGCDLFVSEARCSI